MVIHAQCYPCFLRQVLSVCDVLKAGEEEKKAVLVKVMRYLVGAPTDVPPPYLSREVYNIISKEFGVDDPYREIKKASNKMALRLYPELKKRVKESEDSLYEAVKVAIIGNIIDFGASQDFTLEDVDLFDDIPIAINHYPELKERLERAETVLYIGDNAGEVVFDRVLVEELVDMGKRVFFAVRSKPIINDATKEDAEEAGIDEFAEIVDSGSDAPGVVIDRVTERFKHLFRDADVVLSKGQGNFETLDDVPREIFFLLRAKCPVVAEKLGANIGDIIILRGGRVCHGLLL